MEEKRKGIRRRESRGSTARERRTLIIPLIKVGLGYCCLWAFFHHNKRTAMIATRLGVTTRAIRYHKAAYRAGEFKCEGCEKCLKDLL